MSQIRGYGCAAGALVATTLLAGAASAQALSYTELQATQGMASYSATCVRCHGDKMQGAEGAALTGMQFDANWRGGPVQALADYIRETMPGDKPGSLKPADITVLVAAILKANGIPAGTEPLPANAPATMLIPKK